MNDLMKSGFNDLPPSFHEQVQNGFDQILQPEVQALFTPDLQNALQEAVARGVSMVFWITLIVSLLCLVLSAILPVQKGLPSKKNH